MIPTVATDAQHAQYVENILSTWRRASKDQRKRGKEWYPTANQLADLLSEGNTRVGAAVIAALSPQKSWEENQRLARECIDGNMRGHFADALDKVRRILAGEDPEDVLPMSHKTGMFFRCIADPTDPEAVVIDRHAHDVAVGERYGERRDRGLSNPTRYATLAHAYREAARKLRKLPQEVQAVTWIVQVEDYRWKRG